MFKLIKKLLGICDHEFEVIQKVKFYTDKSEEYLLKTLYVNRCKK